MHYLLSVLIIGALVTLSANGSASLDVPIAGQFRVVRPGARKTCDLWTTIEQIARQSGVRVGLENPPGCPPGSTGRDAGEDALALDGLTPRAAFDLVMQLRPEFSWREVDGVVVWRPVEAWVNQSHALHRPVAAFAVAGVHPHHALHALLASAQPTLFWPHTDLHLSSLGRRLFDPNASGLIDRPISVNFPGGRLLDGLNAVTMPFGGIWQVANPGPLESGPIRPGTHFLRIAVQTLDFDEGNTGIMAHLGPTAPPDEDRYVRRLTGAWSRRRSPSW